MATVLPSEIQVRLSGGPGNGAPIASLGGAMSSIVAPATLLPDVTTPAAASGEVAHRCVYVRNASLTNTATDLKVYVRANTPSVATAIDIAIASVGKNNVEPAIASAGVTPPGVIFGRPSTADDAYSIGTLGPGEWRALWVRRTTIAGAQRYSDDSADLQFIWS